MTVIIRGEREISQRFEQFPQELRQALKTRIEALIQELWTRVESVVPHRTGRLASEITSKVYDDSPTRIAGYVSVYAPDDPRREMPKAGALEYGSSKARKIHDKSGRMETLRNGKRRKIVVGMTKPAHLAARRYLRGPLAEMEPMIRAALEEAVAAAIADASGQGI